MQRLFLVPSEEEALAIQRYWPESPCRVIGVGMAEAAAGAAVAIAESGVDGVVLCGIAGAMSEELVVGQVVEVVENHIAGLPERYSKVYYSTPQTNYQSVVSLTVSHSEDGYLYSDPESPTPQIEEMEGAAVAAVAERFGVDFLHLRAISNRVGDDFVHWHISEALESLAEVLKKLSAQNS